MRQDFKRTSGQEHQNFPSRHHQKEKCWDLLTPPKRCQVFQVKSRIAAIESVNRNRMLDFGKTTGKRIHREPVIEKERSHSSEERHAGFLVGTWYYLFPDPSDAFVSEVVDRKDLALERTHFPGHHFTPTGPTDGHNNESDRAMDDNVFLTRSSDEVYPKHLCPDERVASEMADSAEWKAIVDSGSVKVLDSEVANTIRKERPDRVINSRMVRRLKPQEGTFQKPKAKSRWCVLGHQDPDAADMFTYAPTPQTESIMMFLFLLQLCSLTLSIADLKKCVLSVRLAGSICWPFVCGTV